MRRLLLPVLVGLLAALALPGAALAAAPASAVAPQLSGFPRESQVLSSDTGTWTGTDPITYKRQWPR